MHGRFVGGGSAISPLPLDVLYDNGELDVLRDVLDLWQSRTDVVKLIAAVRAARQ